MQLTFMVCMLNHVPISAMSVCSSRLRINPLMLGSDYCGISTVYHVQVLRRYLWAEIHNQQTNARTI